MQIKTESPFTATSMATRDGGRTCALYPNPSGNGGILLPEIWYNLYMKILSSASRLVFLIMTVALCVFTYKGIVDPKDFMMLASMSFTFYFTRKSENTQSGQSLG